MNPPGFEVARVIFGDDACHGAIVMRVMAGM
jgi:hypothetical protein